MNNIDFKDKATSLFARLKVYTVFLIRYIVFIGRKYPLIAAVFLLFYAFFWYKSLNISTPSSNLPLTTQSPSYSNSNQTPTTAPILEAAQATAIKNGETLTIQFSKPVETPRIFADKVSLDYDCQPKSCKIALSQPLSQIQVYWWQQGKRFVKNFRF